MDVNNTLLYDSSFINDSTSCYNETWSNFNDTSNGSYAFNATECVKYKDPSYYAIPYRIVGTLVQGFILMIGVLGNIMVMMVVTRSRGMKTPTNCYLVSLSMADMMVLLSAVPNEILSYYVLGEEWIWGRVGCGLFIFFQYLGINASSLSITAFTIERYIAICHPMKAQKVCTVHRAKNIICGVWIIAVLYCSPWIFLTKTKPVLYKGIHGIETCTFSLPREYYWSYFFADLILFYIFPLLVCCICYTLIARVLRSDYLSRSMKESKSKEAKKKKKNSKNKSPDLEACHSNSPDHSAMKETSALTCSSHENQKSNSAQDTARAQVIKMLAVVVAVFATLWLPYRGLLVYNSFAEPRFMELWFLMFCKTLIFVNSAINPILYNALSVKFRNAFREMLCCNKEDLKRRNASAASTNLHHTTGQAPLFGSKQARNNHRSSPTKESKL